MPRGAVGAPGRRATRAAQAARPGLRPRVRAVVLLVTAFVGLLLIFAPRVLEAAAAWPGGGSRSSSSIPRIAAQSVGWSGFTPTDWVTSVPFTAAVTAQSLSELQPLSDMYQVSTNGGASWSAWSNAGLSVGMPVSTTHQLAVANLSLPDSASLNYIHFKVTEVGGGEAISPPYLLRVDSAPPVAPQNLVADPATWSNSGSFALRWSNPPDVAGIAGAWYKLESAPTSPSDGTFVVTSNSITGITPAEDGAHLVYVWLQDALGRADPKNAAMTTLYWDTTPPEPPSRMAGSPARQWTNVNKFSETWRNPPDPSAIAGAYYKLDALPVSPTDGTYVSTVNTITNIQVPYEGRHDIYVWLVDGAGNLDPQALTGDPDVFWYDATPPVSTMIVTPTLPATGWYTTSVTVGFAATDLPVDPGYPPVVYYQIGNEPWTAANGTRTYNFDGPHLLQYQARDKAGNNEAVKTFAFGIDKTPPTVTLQPDRLPNANGWYTASMTYTLTAVDTASGAPRGFYRLNDGPWQTGATDAPTTFSLAAEGSYRIQYYGQDLAGNRSTQASTEAHVDATPPTTSMTIEGTAGENGWYVSSVTVHLKPQDNGSGVATTKYRINGGAWQTGTQFALSGDGIYDLSYYSTDAAGNSEPVVTAQAKIDTAAPGAASGLTTAPSGWSRTNSFTVQWSSPSDLSGVTGAYYKLGDVSGGGAPSGPKDGTAVVQTQRIDGLALPAEGAYRLYLWLRDAAGNADQKTAPGGVPPGGPVLRYDATAPATTAKAQGTAGQDGWWLSPISVTLTTTDGASGVAALHYRVDGGAWQATNKTTATVSLTTPDKHVVEYYAEDVAGNFETTRQYTARLDFTPPTAPALVRVLPSSWTRYNSFHIEWTTLTDLSNIGGAYVKFDSPPANATDGTFYPGSTQINGVQAPGEGKHSVYVWLRDGAGNTDSRTAVAISDAVWYDGTPPTSVVTPTAATGLNGWYVEPVTFDVSASDSGSGLLEVHYEVDDGPIQSTTSAELPPLPTTNDSHFVVSAEGRHAVRVWAVDGAGNVEPSHVYQVAIDKIPPSARFTGPASQVTRTEFDVTWTGSDSQEGSGLASYDVQVQDGLDGAWQNWLVGTKLTSARFQGQRSHRYSFRVYGWDVAGNRQTVPGTLAVLVQPVLNGGFDTGVLSDWLFAGPLQSAVVATTGPSGVSTLAAQLGSESYGPSLTPPGTVPAGCATISQAIQIPSLGQVKRPRLQFWYRVLSYDKMWSEKLQTWVDTLDVKLTDLQGQELALLLRAGNPTQNYKVLYDTGWRLADFDLEAYAGQNVNLTFANCNGPQNGRPDNMYNTWSYVDGVKVYDRNWLFAPLMQSSGATSSGAAAAEAGEAGQPAALPDENEPLR